MIQRLGGESLIGLIAHFDLSDTKVSGIRMEDLPQEEQLPGRAGLINLNKARFSDAFTRVMGEFDAHGIEMRYMTRHPVQANLNVGPLTLADDDEIETLIKKNPDLAVVNSITPVLGAFLMKTRASIALKMRYILRITEDIPPMLLECSDGWQFVINNTSDQEAQEDIVKEVDEPAVETQTA